MKTNLERLQLGLVAAVAASCTLSIFAAQVLFAAALAVFLVRWALGATKPPRLSVDAPILAFCVWTLLSASFSSSPVASHESAKKLLLFALIYVAVDALRGVETRERVVDALLFGGLVLSAGALLQYFFLGFDTIDNRPRSFLGHYMTASGIEMATFVLAAGRALFGRLDLGTLGRKDVFGFGALGAALIALTTLQSLKVFATEAERIMVCGVAASAAALALGANGWPDRATRGALTVAAGAVAAFGLVLSLTRNAWLGALVGVGLLALLKARKLVWLLPAGIAALVAFGPQNAIERLTLRDASSRDRYYMWQAAIDMIMDRPVFGQGPGMILTRYPTYRWAEAPNPVTPHLHDNVLQIAAERGIPGALLWVWMFFGWCRVAWRGWRGQEREGVWVSAAAFAVLTSLFVAGLFEYNFGDSELLMLLLVVAALPYALMAEREASPA